MTPRPDVSEERKQQILQSATLVFARLGFNKATMDDIVAESGLSKGTLYWYFKSKDEIIIAILDGFFNEELGALQAMDSIEGSAKEILNGICRPYGGRYPEDDAADADPVRFLCPGFAPDGSTNHLW